MKNNTLNSSYYLSVWIALKSALSLAGAMMTVLALSASFLVESEKGFASSAINSTYYFGVCIVGLFAGGFLQRYSITQIGIFSPIICSTIVFFLASFDHVPPIIGLPSIFCIFFLSGISNPNNIRYYSACLKEDSKMPFFSFAEGSSAALNIIGPLLASYIISTAGPRWCFVIDGITYLLLIIPWIVLHKSTESKQLCKTTQPSSPRTWFEGFHLLYNNNSIRAIVINRMLNNLAIVTFTTALPIVIAKISIGDIDIFAKEQGMANALTSTGFIATSLLGMYFSKRQMTITSMVFMGSFLSVAAYWLLIFSVISPYLLFLGALTLGIGSYCYRISNMTLGQRYAPKDMLGPVIVAGDTIVRGWSFLISFSVIGVFKIVENEPTASFISAFFVLTIPSLALFAPLFVFKLAKNYGSINTAIVE